MRQIISRARFSFTILKKLIKQKNIEIEQNENFRSIQFQKHMKKLILSLEYKEDKMKQMKMMYERLCLTAQRPIETMLKQFLQHCKRYKEDDMVLTSIYLAKCYQLTLTDNGGKLDRFDYQLFESPMWQHYIEEVKYGLSDKSYIQPKNISKVLNALGEINYLDFEVIQLVIQKIQKKLMLPEIERIRYQPRLFQAEKKNYYMNSLVMLDEAILDSEIFKKNIGFLHEKRKQLADKLTFDGISQRDFEGKENYRTVLQLLKSFDNLHLSVDKVLQGIISIRRQYHKLVVLSANQKILRHPQLNYSLLQIQQKLIELHLININDVQKNEMMLDSEYEQRRQEEILKQFMFSFGFGQFQEYLVKEPQNLDYLQVYKQKEMLEFCMFIESLTRYANQPYKLYGSSDCMSLIDSHWQKYFLDNRFNDNNLLVDRIFRRAYVQTCIFFTRNLSVIQFYLLQSSFNTKIYLYSALLEMGFYQELFSQFNCNQLNINQVIQLKIEEFVKLVIILNNLVQASSSPNIEIYRCIQNRVEEFIDNHQELLDLNNLCNIINFIYQMDGIYETNTKLYKRLIKILQRELQNIQLNSAVNRQVTRQAKRILYFQQPQGSKYMGMLSQLQQIQNTSSSNPTINPYLNALNQIFGLSSTSITPYIITGVNNDNQLQGIYFVGAQNSACSGSYVSGNVVAYCLRIYREFGIRVKAMSVNRFVNFGEVVGNRMNDNTGKAIKLQMKSAKEVIAIVQEFLPKNSQLLLKFASHLTEMLQKLIMVSSGNEYKVSKVMSSLRKFLQIYNQEKDVVMIGQFYVKRYELLIQLQLLKKDYKLFTDEQKLQVMGKLEKQQYRVIDIENYFVEIEQQLKKSVGKIQEGLKQLWKKQKNNAGYLAFKGKRLTLNTVASTHSTQKSDGYQQLPAIVHPEYEFLNMLYIIDLRYVQYEDWKNKLKNTMNYHEIKLSQASELTKLLVMRFCPHVQEIIVTLPEDGVAVPFYPVNWEKKYYYHSEKKQEKEHLEKIAQGYRNIYKNVHSVGKKIDRNMLALQNFKYELKLNKSPKEILQYILSFEFIETLLSQKIETGSKDIQEKQQKQKPQFVERDAKQYFSYLQRRNDKMYLESPYLQYIFNKIERIEQLKQLIQERKKLKIRMQVLYNRGEINREQFYKVLKEKDTQLIQELKKLKQKSLSYVNHSALLADSSKIVQLNQNIEELEKIIVNSVNYKKIDDSDYLLTNGDDEEALKLRRSRLENNLILIKILNKLSQNGVLSLNEMNYVRKWKQKNKQGKLIYYYTTAYTNMSIKHLSKIDKQKLKLIYSNLGQQCPNLAVSDLILQLSNFIDESIIFKLQSKLLLKSFKQKFQLSNDIFLLSDNKTFKALAHKVQHTIFSQNSQLVQKQIQSILQLSKMFKTESLSDRQKYFLHYKDLKQNIKLINKCRYRSSLITEYLRQKDYEYYHDLYPEHVQEMKDLEVGKLWNQVFEKQQKRCTGRDIKNVVSQLCRQMMFIRINTPPYFGHFVLEILKNKKGDILTKQKLIAYIELFKVPLLIDSADLLSLAEIQQLNYDESMNELRKESNNNVIESICARL